MCLAYEKFINNKQLKTSFILWKISNVFMANGKRNEKNQSGSIPATGA